VWSSGIKGTDWFVAIGGFRVAEVRDPRVLVRTVADAASPQLTQIFDAGRVAGRDHLYMAAVNAAKSTESGMAVSKNITVEALLYASAQDQITKALATMGINIDSKKVALIVFAHNRAEAEKGYNRVVKLLGCEDDSVLEIDAEKAETLRESYGIGDDELKAAGGSEALGSLIVERGTLLSLRR